VLDRIMETKAATDQQDFAEGFITGWCSLLGSRAIDYVLPAGKSPFECGYDRARSFVTSLRAR
jgi:hypothetical protein